MARKMVLVPQSFLEEMQQSREKDILSLPHPLPYPPEVTAAVKTGQTLDTLNQRGDLTPAQQAALYGQELHRYRTYLQKTKERPTAPTATASSTTTSSGEVEPPAEELVDQIVSSAPKPMRGKAKMMLQHMQRHPQILSWDPQGRVKYRGRVIPNANIIDLVSDAVRSTERKGYRPQGIELFSRGLSEMNMPRDYVRNAKFIKHFKVAPSPKPSTSQPAASSTPTLPTLAAAAARKDSDDEEEDESGFVDASTILATPQRIKTPGIEKRSQSDLEKSWLRLPTSFSSPQKWLFGKK